MERHECPRPVTVEGDWSPAQTKTLRNKLQIYFQSRKKSGGGDCRVEADEGAPRAAVFFQSEEVRERVLTRENHELTLGKQVIRLRLISAAGPVDIGGNTSGQKTQKFHVESGNGAPAAADAAAAAADADAADASINNQNLETAPSVAVVLANVPDSMCHDMLLMLVENVSGLNESSFSLELIWESNKAVVVFNKPEDAEKFVIASQTSERMKKHRLTVQLLEAAKSVRVEGLPPTVVKDTLELYFDKTWILPVSIVMIPEEDAAIISFRDPKVVESICTKEDYKICSTPVKMYPYYEFLSTALYGKVRPTWKLPEPFSERIHHVIRQFLIMKSLLKAINDQMRPYFCSVSLDRPEVKLSPLPSLMRQKGLTASNVNNWMSTAQNAFRALMSQFSAFECPVNAPAWKAVEKEVHSVAGEDAVLVMDASTQVVTVAGKSEDIKQIRAPVEKIILKAMSQIERQTNEISEVITLSPVMFYILTQSGLQKRAFDISPEMKLSYNEGTQKLTICGLSAEVNKTKAWILETKVHMSRKQLNVPSCLQDFLMMADPMILSQDLFTSQGISALYSIDNNGLFLLGMSDSVLADAEHKMKTTLSSHILDVEDEKVLKLTTWLDLNQQLLDSYNSSKKQTVLIQEDPKRRNKVEVAGFVNPVKDVTHSLKEFLVNYTQVQETIRVKSCAVVQFIDKKKPHDTSSIVKANDVSVSFDSEKARIIIAGARLHVQKAKSCFDQLISALSTDNLIVDKPGAKKYFQSQGNLLLSQIMKESGCVVVLRPDNQEEEEEEEQSHDDKSSLCYCRVQTSQGVIISVSKADICSFSADAVVNAANTELQHIGGVALALLKAAGPQLQEISNDYITKNGNLRPGDAIITDAGNLPCKYVIHAVGPRFSDADKKTSVTRLKLAVKESLKQAMVAKCSTIALPAISSGVFGFPIDLCAESIAQALREFCDSSQGPGSLTEIHLVDINSNTVRLLAKAVNQEFIDLGPTMTEPQQVDRGSSTTSSGHQSSSKSSTSPKSHHFNRGGKRGKGAAVGLDLNGNKGGKSPKGHPRLGVNEGPKRLERTTAEGLKIVLCRGNIQDQTTDVIVNTISENMNLNQGAVSKAILKAAGDRLQLAVRATAEAATLQYGEVVITDSFKLACQKVFHSVCPFWDNGRGQAEETLVNIVRYCLEVAEKHKMASLSFPAIGTRTLSFPRDVVIRVLLREIHSFSHRRSLLHLREVVIIVHPSDSQTFDCFTREFKGQTSQRKTQHTVVKKFSYDFRDESLRRSHQTAASFGQVSSPSLDVYQMQMGQIALEVSSGDITKETSDVIVNSSNKDFNLESGVSKAILNGAGLTVKQECSKIVNAAGYQQSSMIMTSGGLLPCKAIIHVVGQKDSAKIKEVVYSVLKLCEENMFGSVSFPALGTGQGGTNPMVAADAMLEAVVEFVRKKHLRSVRNVKIIIFETTMITEFLKSMKKREGEEVEEKGLLAKFKDTFSSIFGQDEDWSSSEDLVLEKEEFEPIVFDLCADSKKCFTREFKGQTSQSKIQHTEAKEFSYDSRDESLHQSHQTAASFSQVSSPSLGVYQMQMGQIALEVSSGDITKETSDVIVNSSNKDFNLESGVSKAILNGAGLTVKHECSKIVNAAGYQQCSMIMTSGGLLPCKAIIHVVGQKDSAKIKEVVYSVLKLCEENMFGSVSFPALGTGQGGTNPMVAADAMLEAVVEFVRKKHPRFVRNVKIIVFKTTMITEFLKSMKKREGEEVEEKGLLAKFKDTFSSIFGQGEDWSGSGDLVLEKEEFEPTVFDLCADSKEDVSCAKRQIEALIVAEQAERTISDPYISQLSQDDMDQLKALQRKLTVSIRLYKGLEDQEPKIHLEGLTRDVLHADSAVRDIIKKVERAENLKSKALMMSALVEWQFEDHIGMSVPFDMYTNLKLEEALEKKQSVMIKIYNQTFKADAIHRKAVSTSSGKKVEIIRKDLKDDNALPAHWGDMKGDLVKLFPVTEGSKEYSDVEKELTKSGLTVNIILIERVQNSTLWKSYQLLKKQLEVKNKHTNNEMLLFHGTGVKSIDLINTKGFNRSYAGAHGVMYGNGSYFAVDPAYSAQGYAMPDASGRKRLYLARVLVGDYTRGGKGMITPPSKNSRNAADLYDSVVDDTAKPKMFVVFNDMQAYPEYIITFT